MGLNHQMFTTSDPFCVSNMNVVIPKRHRGHEYPAFAGTRQDLGFLQLGGFTG